MLLPHYCKELTASNLKQATTKPNLESDDDQRKVGHTQRLPEACFNLRDYQTDLIQQVFFHWTKDQKRILLQLPTGGGKTVLFTALIRELVLRGGAALVLVHREELLLQAKQTIEAMAGMLVGVIKSGYPVDPLLLIQVASVQTLTRRQDWPKADLVICDEAHHSCSASYTKIFAAYPGAYILGVTATPARIDGQGFKFLYDALILGPSVRELIEAGYLSKFKLFATPKAIQAKGIRTTGGDFNQRELAALIDTSLVMGDLILTWERYANGKKTVVFAVTIEHSKAIAQAYQEAGVPAEHLDGETPSDERKAILARFAAGETLVLTNCGIVSEGFDVPSIEAIQCVRPTKSLVLWLQMVGRALRPHPGKDHAVIIDHSENWAFHSLPDEEREWSLEPVSLKSLKWALKCPSCDHIFKPLPGEQKRQIADCPNCQARMQFEPGNGADPPPPRLIFQDEQVQLEEVRLEADPEILAELDWLTEVQEDKGYKRNWIYYQAVERWPDIRLAELRALAKILGYKPGWAYYRWQDLQEQRQAKQQGGES